MRGFHYRVIGLVLLIGVFATSALLIHRSGLGGHVHGSIWNGEMLCAGIASSAAGGASFFDFFTGDGSYMPRTHCMVTSEGETDWFWVWTLLGLNGAIIAGYARIFVFWRNAYKQEQEQDRNTKLMDLAWIFLFCACCGYVSSIMLFFWPGYRFLALMLVPLAFFTWRFAWNLESFRLSLSAKRLARELNESLQEQNERLSREIEIATHDLREAKIEAERANQAKSDFLARMTHELRTPLTSMIGFLDLAVSEDDDDQRMRCIQTVRRNSTHLLSLVNDVLDVSKIEAGKMTIELGSCSIPDLFDEVVGLLTPRAESEGTTIHVEVDRSVPDQIVTDPTRLRQLVTNLVGNAIKFTRDGEVTVCARIDEGNIRIDVCDTGLGMTPEQQLVVFDKFAQADAGIHRSFGGSGLGLTISRDIARALGGDLTLESELGIGSCFTCVLPVRLEGADQDEMVNDQESLPLEKNLGVLDRSRVLLVEDMVDNIKMFGRYFARVGVELESARDGREGLGKIMSASSCGEPYDIVLMDMSMPELDGLACLREVRRMGIGVPIVMVSAHAFPEEQERCMSSGASGYVTKPVDFEQLISLCASLIDHGQGEVAA
jgi:signal transduction histidine kinase/ActR/RegA family two-component response regulator